jgi:hypothetical protein
MRDPEKKPGFVMLKLRRPKGWGPKMIPPPLRTKCCIQTVPWMFQLPKYHLKAIFGVNT